MKDFFFVEHLSPKGEKNLVLTKKGNLLLFLASYFFLSLSFPTFYPITLPVLAWIALVPWFFLVQRNSFWKGLILSFLLGISFFATSVYWIGKVTPPGYITTVLIFGLYSIIFFMGAYFFFQTKSPWAILSVSMWWIFVHYIRANYLFIRFPWYTLGYSQGNIDLIIQSADIWGIFGITLLVVLVNASLFSWLDWKISKEEGKLFVSKALTAFSVLFLLSTIIYSWFRLSHIQKIEKECLTLTIIQANIPQELKASGLSYDRIQREHMELTQEAYHKGKTDLILWPETMFTPMPVYMRELVTWIARHKQPMLVGAVLAWRDKKGEAHFTNSILYFNKRGQIVEGPQGDYRPFDRKPVGIYDKVYLVPLSEYIPFKKSFPPLYRLLKSWIPPGFASMDHGDGAKVFSLKGHKFAPSICFEISFPLLSREGVQKGAHLLLNLSNDGWFMGTRELENSQILGRVRAIETRRGVVRALNGGYSCFIHPTGSIINLRDKQGRVGRRGFLTQRGRTTSILTLYVKWGDWIMAFPLLVLINFLAWTFLNTRRKRKDETSKEA
ncbi:MAG: apolipoprotein N-acyltransferase [Planctomycetota bacterium]|nr:MAG: apolipoprotein N-acyltransferase [Planctomycetota bacterium]